MIRKRSSGANLQPMMSDEPLPTSSAHAGAVREGASEISRSDSGWSDHSGAAVATLFHRAMGAVFLLAWASLSSQILLLVGSRGLLPLVDFVEAARDAHSLSFFTFPSVLAWLPRDGALYWGTLPGMAIAALQILGRRPRTCAALQTAWYLGYVTICRGFLGFQWDNLLLECGFLAAFLPTDRSAPLAHLLMRALLFKLYFESGLAKWQSPLHDWRDGSAMTYYFQTAPLPTKLAWYAHHLPRWWHIFESYATLWMELVLPFAIFGTRRFRIVAALAFTIFQGINVATANYAFFCYLTVALHVFLLDDADVTNAMAWLRRRAELMLRRPHTNASQEVKATPQSTPQSTRSRTPVRIVAIAWAFLSLTEAWFQFGDPTSDNGLTAALVPVLEWSRTYRVVNAFHLFSAVTRERIEPEFQTADESGTWTARDLRFKAGDPLRAPPFVAPHQPRVDFLLWFYGLSYQRQQPTYVATLLARLCEDPSAVADLFQSSLPLHPTSVRIVFWEYAFTSAAEKHNTGAWWTRHEIGSTQSFACHQNSP